MTHGHTMTHKPKTPHMGFSHYGIFSGNYTANGSESMDFRHNMDDREYSMAREGVRP